MATHWRVRSDVRAAAETVRFKFGGSWNTYDDHPPGYHLDDTSTDHWSASGRGSPLDEHTGDAMVAWILGQHQVMPVRWLIWWSWWWRPGIGWAPYSGWQGNHGPGPDAHIHVTYA